MATVYSTAYNSIYQAVPSSVVRANEIGGRVRVAYAVYTAAALAANDVVNMFRLPQGARILSGTLSHDALGSGTQLSVGHGAYTDSSGSAVAASAAYFKAAAASTTAGTAEICATRALGKFDLIDIDGDVKDNAYDVTVTLTGGAATGDIVVMMMYVVD